MRDVFAGLNAHGDARAETATQTTHAQEGTVDCYAVLFFYYGRLLLVAERTVDLSWVGFESLQY